jgi:hypothetical protein
MDREPNGHAFDVLDEHRRLRGFAQRAHDLFMPGVSGALSLINIETKGLGGWLFDDVIVTHVGTLS